MLAGKEVRLDRRRKVELFEEIRREYEHGVGTIRGVGKKLGVHRRMAREALASAVPRERKVADREKPRLGPAIAFINTVFEEDKKAPRKQRHTAHRIWERLCKRSGGGRAHQQYCRARGSTGSPVEKALLWQPVREW